MLLTTLLFFFLTQTHFLLAQAPDPLVIKLPNGLIKGFKSASIANKTFYAFRNIPYAAPPVGNLRFQPPQPALNWEGTREAIHINNYCFQASSDSDQENEDCLFINVFTPQLVGTGKPLLPVMVYIHGGGFVDGNGVGLAPDLYTNNDVLFVAFNYRLGIFGFLSTQDAIIPGNNGLKDQHQALQWVHDNIHLFGGDPNLVTIFGESAGSASCGYQLLNQNNRGLFRAAILQSGSSLSPWAFQRRAREIAFATASYIDPAFAHSNDSQFLLDYLLHVPARDIDAAAKQFHNHEYGAQDIEIYQGFYFSPVVEVKNEHAFLTNPMYGLIKQNNVVQVPLIMGMTSEEGISFTSQDPVYLKNSMAQYDVHPEWLVPNDMKITDNTKRIEMGRQIRQLYTGGAPWADSLGASVRHATDTAIARSVTKHAELSSRIEHIFFYIFSHNGKMGNNRETHYDGTGYVAHAEDLHYLFCGSIGCDDSQYSEIDRVTRQRMIKLWTNFAKYLNPTPAATSDLFQNVTWPTVKTASGDFTYLDIGDNLVIKNHPRQEAYAGWTRLYNSLGYDNFDTY